MQHERDLLVGCGAHERSPARECYRNGYEERGLDTRFRPSAVRRTKCGYSSHTRNRRGRIGAAVAFKRE